MKCFKHNVHIIHKRMLNNLSLSININIHKNFNIKNNNLELKKLLNKYNLIKINYFTMVDKVDNKSNSFKLSTYSDVENLLKINNIKYYIQEHKEVKTAEEHSTQVICNNKDIDFQFLKNLVYKSKAGNFVYICLLPDQKISTKALELFTNEKNLRAADSKYLEELLNVKGGSVNPLSLLNLNDNKSKFKFYLDSNINKEYIAIHPMINTHTVWIKRKELLDLLDNNCIKHTVWNQAKTVEATTNKNNSKPEKATKTNNKNISNNKDTKETDHELDIQNDKINQFSEWYPEVIKKSEMVDNYDISGCYILRPWGYSIWESIKSFFDDKIKSIGVENCYFPMFVSQDALEKEKNHVEGFSPEVAWVTHYGDKKLENKIAIRPTSETIMYPLYSKWIRSHRDLPLLLNQWANVIRWEFKHPTPFIRTREFLWQEGHTAHETEKDTDDFVLKILGFYRDIFEELLAVPVVQGYKSENEKFAGAIKTTSIETLITENGKGIQCATSHNLGQNFSKMFDITYLDKNQKKEYVWQSSWGVSTRSIGTCVMVHGDNKGLVLPPRVAPIQVVFIPIVSVKDKTSDIADELTNIYKQLKNKKFRVKFDDDEVHTAGFKFNYWERKGVPLRVEMGRKDYDKKVVTLAFRDNFEKITVPLELAVDNIITYLDKIQLRMFEKAKQKFESKKREANEFNTFNKHLNDKCAILTPWCGNSKCEDNVKDRIKELSTEDENNAGTCKILNIPFEFNKLNDSDKCFNCGEKALTRAMWGRSY